VPSNTPILIFVTSEFHIYAGPTAGQNSGWSHIYYQEDYGDKAILPRLLIVGAIPMAGSFF
jgi:hypothetical protein